MNNKSRRVLGIIFGMILGLAYSAVTQWINSIFLSGVPLFAPPPGRFVTLIIYILGGGALGFLVTWPEEFLLGVFISSVSGTLVSSLVSLLIESGNPDVMIGNAAVLLITFLPRVFFFVPATILVRWVVSMWEKETLYTPFSLKKRLGSLVLLVALGLMVGAFSLYPTQTRLTLTNLNELILTGKQAIGAASLPASLQTVDGFVQNSDGPYSLLILSDSTQVPIQRATVGFAQDELAIEVLFANGFRFGCVYNPAEKEPICVHY
jgi:hypothetical protein